MKTKLDYYKIFYETARSASFSTAAKNLYISQSAISQCIRQLENDLNSKLFLRTRRGVSLTKEGEFLYEKIEVAINSIEQGETMLARLHHLESGSLTIAAGDSVTSHYLLPYLEEFHKSYPNIRIEMANSYSHQLLNLVKQGKSELAFVNLPVSDPELIIEPCFDIHDIFVCGKERNLRKSYSWEEIASEPLILLETNSNSRQNLDRKFKEKNIILEPQIEVAVHDLLIQFASIHLGISCVVEEFSKESLKSGVIKKIPLKPPLPKRSIGCAYLKKTPLSLPSKEFLKLIQKESQA